MGYPRYEDSHAVNNTPAIWTTRDAAAREGFCVGLFRRSVEVAKGGAEVALLVTASERCEVWWDGEVVARGPSRSDPLRWGVMRVALGRVAAGRHVLAIRVRHAGRAAGIGQMGGPAFLLVCAESDDATVAAALSTGEGWRALADESFAPIMAHAWGTKRPYMAVGGGEERDGRVAPWGWETPDYDDGAWEEAAVVARGAADPWGNLPLKHVLRPEPLPQMRERTRRFVRVAEAPEEWLADAGALIRWEGALTIPARGSGRIVFDRGELSNAYPDFTLSGGAGSRIEVISVEAPRDRAGKKVNRDRARGMLMWGMRDVWRPDGGDGRRWTTLWFRSFRYLVLRVRVGDAPLTIGAAGCRTTGYPLDQRAAFRASGAEEARLTQMWEVSARSIRLCAHETFFDCPHYEQAQFPGDTRVQAIYHYLVCDDEGLARKAIDDFHASRLADGMLQCRYPSRSVQVLPTYALAWVGMLHDFRVYRGDGAFVAPYLPAAREVIAWFEDYLRPDGLLGHIPHAPFLDWAPGFAQGNAPQDEDGGSLVLTCMLAEACGWLAGLERWAGYRELGTRWEARRKGLLRAALANCRPDGRGILPDTAARRSFSVHAQVQAILAGACGGRCGRTALEAALGAEGVTQPGTHYYRYFVAQAMKACGGRAGFWTLLARWDASLAGTGLTTWPESDGEARSDCHAWSVTPAIEFLETVLGIAPDPRAHGWGAATFAPTLGPLPGAEGRIATPAGTFDVALSRQDGAGVSADITTPAPLTVVGVREELPPGRHRLMLR